MGPQPDFSCEWNYDIFQVDLPHAIKVCSRFPPSHAQKRDKLNFLEYLIMQGADPRREMNLQGERATPLQRAIEYGDPLTIQCITDAVERYAKEPPLVVCRDLDAHRDDRARARLPVAILFPGQGSQYVKMLTEVKGLEPCRRLIEQANDILGYNILDLCLNGPAEKLEETKYCQPALFVANCCALEKLRLEKPEVVERASATAGLSLGEYNALWYAGVLGFEDCLRIVRVRADAMHEESRKSPQAMISVAGLDQEVLEDLCLEAGQRAGRHEEGRDFFCQIANHLFPKGYTCAGDKAAIEQLRELALQRGALQVKDLPTSGAFHTKLMEPASTKLLRALKAKITDMNFPQVDVYMNVRGAPQRRGTDPRELNYDLAAQVAQPVLWRQCMEEMLKDGVMEFYECGPMKQLKAMMKRISQDAWERTHSISV